MFFSSFTALFLKSLYSVVAITGSLGGSLIEAIIPAMLWACTVQFTRRYLKYLKEIGDVDRVLKSVYAWTIIAIGAVIAILGTYESIASFSLVCWTFSSHGWKVNSVCLSKRISHRSPVCRSFAVPPFRAFVGLSILLLSGLFMGWREIRLGEHLSTVNAILHEAVRIINSMLMSA